MKRFNNILCVVEQGREDTAALERAVMLAENNQSPLTLAVVLPQEAPELEGLEHGPTAADLRTATVDAAKAYLGRLAGPFGGRVDITTEVLGGIPFLEIIRQVLVRGHDLVVKSPEDPDWLDRLFGGDDMHLLRKCPCPVWMVKPGSARPYRRILAAVDVEEGRPDAEARRAINLQILEMAGSLALSEFAELHIVHVWDAIGEGTMRSGAVQVSEGQIAAYVDQVRRRHQESLDKLLAEWQAGLGAEAAGYLKPHKSLVRGWARKAIPETAARLGTDLVVMGTVARTGVPGFFMGNTAELVLPQIHCSVLAIKPPGFKTPVVPEG